jgi:GT2 family glycosyltransferase
VRTSAIQQAGLFDEHFQIYGMEDTEYAYRLYKRSPGGFFASQRPLSWHHHYHTFEETCESLYQCGFENLPYLQSIQPQVAALFGIHYANFSKENWWQGLMGQILLKPWLAKVAQGLYRWTPYPFSNTLVRYLGLYHLVNGYRDWLKKQGAGRVSV